MGKAGKEREIVSTVLLQEYDEVKSSYKVRVNHIIGGHASYSMECSAVNLNLFVEAMATITAPPGTVDFANAVHNINSRSDLRAYWS